MDPLSNSLPSWLGGIPVVTPVPLTFGGSVRLLAAGANEEPDYTVYALDAPAPAAALPPSSAMEADEARRALDEMESAARVSEYHDFDWWRARIAVVRMALER